MPAPVPAPTPGESSPEGDLAARPGRRADATRNHREVFAAAVELFAERGLDATVPDVAARAGVGRATVYRSYPTKADLVEAVAREHIGWLASQVSAAMDAEDALEGLSMLLGAVSERLAVDRLFAHVLSSTAGRERGVPDRQFARLLSTAQQQGHIRDDVVPQDVAVLMGGVARVLLDLDERDPRQWRRYVDLVLDALRDHSSR